MSQTTTHDIGMEGLDSLSGVDALCLFVAEDDRPLPATAGYVDWRLCGVLSRVLKGGFFSGVKDDWLLLPADGKLEVPRIFVVGLAAMGVQVVRQLRESRDSLAPAPAYDDSHDVTEREEDPEPEDMYPDDEGNPDDMGPDDEGNPDDMGPDEEEEPKPRGR